MSSTKVIFQVWGSNYSFSFSTNLKTCDSYEEAEDYIKQDEVYKYYKIRKLFVKEGNDEQG